MSATFIIDWGLIEEAFDRIEEAKLSDADFENIGARAVDLVLTRTGAGLNPYGLPFARYSTATAKSRLARGRVIADVTLTDTGRMLGGLTSTVVQGSARLAFVGEEQRRKAAFHDTGTRHMPARPFLRFYPQTATYRKLTDLAARLLARNIEKALKR